VTQNTAVAPSTQITKAAEPTVYPDEKADLKAKDEPAKTEEIFKFVLHNPLLNRKLMSADVPCLKDVFSNLPPIAWVSNSRASSVAKSR
jgi:hypothetical protein